MKQLQDGQNMKKVKNHKCECKTIWEQKEQRLKYLEHFHNAVIHGLENKLEFINEWVLEYTMKKNTSDEEMMEVERYSYLIAEELCKADLKRKNVTSEIVYEWLNRGNL